MAHRTLTLLVQGEFSDAWLETDATPEERTALLRFACTLPRATSGIDHAALERLVESTVTRATSESTALRKRIEGLERALHEAHAREAQHETLVTHACHRATEEERQRGAKELKEVQKKYESVCVERTTVEQQLMAQMRAQLEETVRTSKECEALRSEVNELRTPAGRGRTGEFSVATCLQEMGFEVEDTSMGARKDDGYMDLLAHPRGANMRIAIE